MVGLILCKYSLILLTLESALESLKRGKFILIHDSQSRENEIDMVVASQFTTPEHIGIMRNRAGGLLCTAIDGMFADKLDLKFMHDILESSQVFNNKDMIAGISPYGDRPSFSITINHIDTYTGITDIDRSKTITKFSALFNLPDPKTIFTSTFKTPGHVPLLLAHTQLLKARRGHTEMSVYLAKLANLIPIMTICEMMDIETHTALSIDKAQQYAKQNNISLVNTDDLLQQFMVTRN